jgi:hypothetical protein
MAEFIFDDIDYIIYNKSVLIDDKILIPFTLHAKFHFIKLVMKNGVYINITSFMKYDTESIINLFDSDKVIRLRNIFPFTFKSYASSVKRYKKSLELDKLFQNIHQ